MLARMEAQRTGLREQFNTRYLLLSAGKALAGALLLALFYYGAFRAWRRVRRFFLLRILEKRSAIPQHWRRYLGNIEVRLYAVLVILLGMLACYLWLSWAFSLFPLDAGVERIAGGLVAGGDPRPLSVDCRLPAGADDRGAYFPSHRLIIRLVKVVLDRSPPAAFRFPAFIRRPLAPPVGLSRWSSGCLPSPPPTRSFPAPTPSPSKALACSSA